jgi:DedD protein
MRLREETRIKEKMEFQIDTRHVFYLIVWSVVFSGIIFYTGLVVGERTQTGLQAAPQVQAVIPHAPKDLLKEDSQIPPFPLMADLKSHPEKVEIGDVVLNALARLRLETLERIKLEDEVMKEELANEIFQPRHQRRMARNSNAQEMLGETAGIGLSAPAQPKRRLAKAPEMELPQPEPERVAVAEPDPEPDLAARVKPRQDESKVQQPKMEERENEAGKEGRYSIQAKSFRDRNEALIFLGYLQKEARKSKVKPYIMPVDLPTKGRWYRVRMGRFQTRLDAQKYKEQFEKKEGIQTFLVKL